MFRVPVGVTGDAGRQRRHFSAKAAWKQEEPLTKRPRNSRARRGEASQETEVVFGWIREGASLHVRLMT